MSDTQRNFLILGAVVVAVALLGPAGAGGVNFLSMLVGIAFTIVLVWFLVSLYQRNSGTIALMPAAPRLTLQACGVALVAIVVTGFLHAPFLPFPFGWSSVYPMLFWPALLACCFGLWWSWQQRTSKW